MAFVLDASAAIPWCFKDEETEQTRTLQDRLIRGEPVVVPEHWQIELSNVLLMGVRRGRVAEADVRSFWVQLAALDILIAQHAIGAVFNAVAPLATLHRLTAYDAAYLELALRRGLPLATLDSDLATAAWAEGVPLLL